MPIYSKTLYQQSLQLSVCAELKLFNNFEMIWDRGAHSTIISDGMLSDAFRQYLTLPAHDLYNSDTGVKVQMDGEIRFSNTIVQIDCNCLVVPTSEIPNQRVGVLLGQRGAIDRIIYTSAPRANLVARGLSLPPNVCVLWPIWWNLSIPTGPCPGYAFVCTTRPRRSHRFSYFFINFSLENIQGLYAEIWLSKT